MSDYTPGCACSPPHEENDQCGCPCHEPDPVERTLALVSGRVYRYKSKHTLGYDLLTAMERWAASYRAGGGSAVAERNRLLQIAALCVAKHAREVAR